MGISPAQLWAMGDEQVDLLLACGEVEADIGPHGQFMSEATSPEADPNNYDGSYRFVARPVVDWAERAIVQERKALQAQTPDEDLSDIRFVVERVDYDRD